MRIEDLETVLKVVAPGCAPMTVEGFLDRSLEALRFLEVGLRGERKCSQVLRGEVKVLEAEVKTLTEHLVQVTEALGEANARVQQLTPQHSGPALTMEEMMGDG